MDHTDLRYSLDIVKHGQTLKKSLMESAYYSRWGTLSETDKIVVRGFDEIIPLLIEYTKLVNNSSILLEFTEDPGQQKLNKKQIQQLFITTVRANNYKNEQGDLKDFDPSGPGEGELEKGTKEKASKIKKWVEEKLKKIVKATQDSKPVQNFDNTVEKFVNELKEKDTKFGKAALAVGEYAKEHPKLTNFAIGVLTAAVSMAGTPVVAAGVGMLLRSAVGVMKGEKASTAIAKSAMVAGLGVLAGLGLKELGEVFQGMRFDVIPFEDQGVTIDVNLTGSIAVPGFEHSMSVGKFTVPNDFAPLAKGYLADAKDGSLNALKQLYDLASVDWRPEIEALNDISKEVAAENDSFLQNLKQITNIVSAAGQGGVQALGRGKKS